MNIILILALPAHYLENLKFIRNTALRCRRDTSNIFIKNTLVVLNGGCFHLALRSANSLSESSTCNKLLSASIVIISPFLISARFPPVCASGVNTPDYKTVRPAGKPSVGNKRNTFAKSGTHNGSRYFKHFSHPRSAFRSLVTDNNNITG